MAHEITDTDHMVLAKQRAWHGLGTVVEDAPTTDEALKLARLDWLTLETHGLTGTTAGVTVNSDKWKFLVRSDNQQVLGCVTDGYEPVQNHDLARFCEELSLDTVVKVESAGSLFGGRRVWYLLQTDTFDVGNDDPVTPYILVANSHDGSLAFTGMTTSVRVVCNNTLSWAMKGNGRVFSYKHTAGIMSRLPDATRKMRDALAGRKNFEEACKHLRSKQMTTEQVQSFFLNMYASIVDPIVKSDPTANGRYYTQAEDNRYQKALHDMYDISRNFDAERGVAGTTYWNAFNASSRWLQNRTRQGSDAANVNKVMGVAADNTSKAFKMALAAAGT